MGGGFNLDIPLGAPAGMPTALRLGMTSVTLSQIQGGGDSALFNYQSRAKSQTETSFNFGLTVQSDRRLKRDVVALGTREDGLGLYRYRYLWSDVEYVGVMAQEVALLRPNAVVRGADGYLRVDYMRLGLAFQTWNEWAQRAE
jgi:hypothetical protein